MNRKPEDMAAVFINEVAFRSAKWSWYIFFPPKNPSPENDEINRANWRGKIFLSFFFFFSLYFLTILKELQSIVFTIYEGSTFPFSLEKLR